MFCPVGRLVLANEIDCIGLEKHCAHRNEHHVSFWVFSNL